MFMHDARVNVFLPMRKGSERIFQKNTREFADVDGGLCKIKLDQLLKCKYVDKIIVSTNDPLVFKIIKKFNSDRILIIDRPEALGSSATSTDDLIQYVPQIMPDGFILWTHVTSPFLTAEVYDQIIQSFLDNFPEYDSLMTVTKIQKFLWDDTKPINYDRCTEKWPRTQTLKPIWEVNSGAFLASKEIYLKRKDRIGIKPYLFSLDADLALDIDWMSDFKMAETLFHRQSLSDDITKHIRCLTQIHTQ